MTVCMHKEKKLSYRFCCEVVTTTCIGAEDDHAGKDNTVVTSSGSTQTDNNFETIHNEVGDKKKYPNKNPLKKTSKDSWGFFILMRHKSILFIYFE